MGSGSSINAADKEDAMLSKAIKQEETLRKGEINDQEGNVVGDEICSDNAGADSRSKHSEIIESFSSPPKYPMYAIQISDFDKAGLTELPRHEDARRDGLLKEVVEREGHPGSLFIYHVNEEGTRGGAIEYEVIDGVEYETKERVFNRASVLSISHRWFRPNFDPQLAHPDGEDHRKFSTMLRYLSEHHPDSFLWMDYFSIPQDPARRDLQEAAIQSLPKYFMYSSNTLILCDTFQSLMDQESGYLSRGHCLLELVTTKLPRIDVFGKWYIPGFEKCGQWGKTIALEIQSGETLEVTWDHFASAGSPVNGNFTVPDDCKIIRPLVDSYVEAFRLFHAHFMKPMMACESWEEVFNLPNKEERLPQIWNTSEYFDCPRKWCEFVLPEIYADVLAHGQAKAMSTS